MMKVGKNVNWLGWQDSNLRVAVSKTAALPLGYIPKQAIRYIKKVLPATFISCSDYFCFIEVVFLIKNRPEPKINP